MNPHVFAVVIACSCLAAQSQFRSAPVGADAIVTDAVFLDVDGDGDQDLLVARRATISWLENDGAGEFSEHVLAITPFGLPRVGAGDIDGDGDIDGLVISPQLDTSYVIRNTGGVPAAVSLGLPAISSVQYRINVVDLDGDRDPDVVLMPPQGQPSLLRNDGAGHFAVETRPFAGINMVFQGSVEAGDIDGNGTVDLFALGLFTSRLLLNDGTGNFTESSVPVPTVGVLTSSAIGDFTGDGLDDVVVARSAGGSVLLAADGVGGLRAQGSVSVGGFYAAAAVDVDEDGDLDVVGSANSSGTNAFYVLLNDGSGVFTDGTPSRVDPFPFSLSVLALGDVDGDGDVDGFVGGFPLPVARPQRLFVNHHRQVWIPAQAGVGQGVAIRCSYQPGYSAAVGLALPVFGSAATTPLPTPWGAVHLDPAQAVALPFLSLPAPMGEGEVQLVIPNDPALVGTVVRAQALVLELFGAGPPHLTGFRRIVVQ